MSKRRTPGGDLLRSTKGMVARPQKGERGRPARINREGSEAHKLLLKEHRRPACEPRRPATRPDTAPPHPLINPCSQHPTISPSSPHPLHHPIPSAGRSIPPQYHNRSTPDETPAREQAIPRGPQAGRPCSLRLLGPSPGDGAEGAQSTTIYSKCGKSRMQTKTPSLWHGLASPPSWSMWRIHSPGPAMSHSHSSPPTGPGIAERLLPAS